MPASTVLAIPKIIGIISLGLLTGTSTTLSALALPSLLTLPSATQAHRTYKTLIANALLLTRALSTVSIASFAVAYLISPFWSRHPYLIWSALLAGGALGVEYASPARGGAAGSLALDGRATGAGTADDGGNGMNGEVVETAVRGRMWMETQRAALSGLGFVMSVVGIWGDGA